MASVLVRLERAATHLAEFERQARPIITAYKDNVTRERDDRNSEYVFRLIHAPTIPATMSAVIGDAIHNLRVSLDYLARQLVLATGLRQPGNGTVFPVCQKIPAADHLGVELPNIEPGVPYDVRATLDEVQPYQRPMPKSHDLAMLHRLDIIDKHRALLFTVVSSNVMGFWGDAIPSSRFNPGPYTDGAEIVRFSYSGVNADFAPMMMFDVRLAGPDAGYMEASFSAADLVRMQLRYIENEVLPRFEGFLGS